MSENIPQILEAAVQKIAALKEPTEGQYLAPDGLIYCTRCHTPTQCRVRLLGHERIVPCMCDCEKKAKAEAKQRIVQEEHRKRIQRLKTNGIQDRQLLECRFAVAEDNKDIRMAKRYVENWSKVKAENLGLLLWGAVGGGKSFVAACIANALLENGVPVLMTNFSKILNQMGTLYSEERYRYIEALSHYSLLIIDDLGIERSTEYVLEQIFAVIDERYKSGLPLIITTNLTITELRNPPNVEHARIYSRILEMCTPVQITGCDRRRKIGQEKQTVIKEVLDL